MRNESINSIPAKSSNIRVAEMTQSDLTMIHHWLQSNKIKVQFKDEVFLGHVEQKRLMSC